jgi:hypothetical protein
MRTFPGVMRSPLTAGGTFRRHFTVAKLCERSSLKSRKDMLSLPPVSPTSAATMKPNR